MKCICGCGESFSVDPKYIGKPRKYKNREHYERSHVRPQRGSRTTAHGPGMSAEQRAARLAIGLPA